VNVKLTPMKRNVLQCIADAGERGRLLMWVLAVDQLPWRGYEDLKNAGYVEDVPEPGQERVRITAAGRAALAGEAP
jgi:hypothetical protein